MALNEELIRALALGTVDEVKNLLSAGADPNTSGQDSTQRQALHYAVERADLAMVTALLQAGADPNVYDENHSRPLHEAVRQGQPEIVEALLDAGARAEVRNQFGFSPLQYWSDYCERRNLDIPRLLLEAGADPNPRRSKSELPLLHGMKDLELISLLIEFGADVNGVDERTNMTPLHHAPSVEVTHLLIEAGADVHARSKSGHTPLHAAIRGPSEAVPEEEAIIKQVRVLVDAGADIHAVTNDGRTVVGEAIRQRAFMLTRYLIAAGADVDQPSGGIPPVFNVATNSEFLELLLEAGAEANVAIENGTTALHMAARGKAVTPVKMLLNAGADPNAKNKHGQKPIDWAKRKPIRLAIQKAMEADG